LKSTFSLEGKDCPSVGDVGANWLTETLSGEIIGKVQLEYGEVFLGKERESSLEGRFSYNKCSVVRASKRRVCKRNFCQMCPIWKTERVQSAFEKYRMGRKVKSKLDSG
jgi:hypothetical protein